MQKTLGERRQAGRLGDRLADRLRVRDERDTMRDGIVNHNPLYNDVQYKTE